MSFKSWKLAKVRAIGRENYIRFTPNFGFGITISKNVRLRFSFYHGLQLVAWARDRWVVRKQLLGRSKVKGEKYAAIR